MNLNVGDIIICKFGFKTVKGTCNKGDKGIVISKQEYATEVIYIIELPNSKYYHTMTEYYMYIHFEPIHAHRKKIIKSLL